MWRTSAKQRIALIVKEHGCDDLDALERELWARFPWLPRKHWPYKVWLSEVKATMNRLRAGKSPPPVTPDDVKHFWVDEPEEA